MIWLCSSKTGWLVSEKREVRNQKSEVRKIN
jgi:hypothetical protein